MVVVVVGVGKDRVGKKKKEGILLTQAFLFPSLKLPLDLRQSSHRGIAAHPYT